MSLAELSTAIGSVAGADGVSPAPVPGVICLRRASTTPFESRRWRASLALVTDGVKDLVLGARTHALSAGRYTLTPLALPVVSRFAVASPARPFTGLLVEVDPVALSGLVAELAPVAAMSGEPVEGLFVGELDDAMLDAAIRIGRLFGDPEAAAVLGPGRVRELLFAALRGPSGEAIRRFVEADSATWRVARAVHHIGADLADDLDIPALAREAGMSRTVFFTQFKRVTAATPVQYQKRLRLLEAQRLMVEEAATAEAAALDVGYRSPSQFSREYRRMFGAPPSTHASRLRRAEVAAGA